MVLCRVLTTSNTPPLLKNEYIHISITSSHKTHNKQKRNESTNMSLSSARVAGERTGAIFPGSNGKVGARCQIPSNGVPLLLRMRMRLLLSRRSLAFCSITLPTVPGASSRRIGAKLSLLPASKGYVDARTAPGLLLFLLGVQTIRSAPSLSTPSSPTPRVHPTRNAC